MKIRVLLMTAVLGLGGPVLAQTRDAPRPPERTDRAVQQRAPDDAAARREGGGVVDATRSGAKRAWDATKRTASRGADALRRTGQAIERRLPGTHEQASQDRADSRAMGAAPADADGDRRNRMDQAYGNWKRQNDSR